MTFSPHFMVPYGVSHPRLIVWELKCLKWLFSSVIAFRSGLYLGRSLSESYKHSKWLFRRTSWCPNPRLIVWELKCLKWLFSSAIAFRSGLYLGRSLSESYKHSKWLFRRTSWCPMASPHPRLIVWELKCLKWFFSSVIVVTGKFRQAHGNT